MRKLDQYVDFPKNGLNLSICYSHTASPPPNIIYDLIAVSNHMGSIHGGHYTAYARQRVGEPWYLFDDRIVTRVYDDRNVVSRNAYILVYIRRENDEKNFEK